MAFITNAQVINWDNQRARTLADAMTFLLAKLIAYQADYAAQGINAAIVADAAGSTAVIADNPANPAAQPNDGRQPVTGTSLQNFIAGINQLVTAWNVTAVSGVGTTVAAIQNGIQVNGSLR